MSLVTNWEEVQRLYKDFFTNPKLTQREKNKMIASDLFLYAWFYFTEIKKIRPVGLRHQPNATLTSPSTTDYLTQILLFFQKVMRSTPESPRYYFLNCPPRLGKTTLLHLFLTFQFISNPVSHSMYFTCSQILAQDVTPKVSEIISSPFFRQLAGYIRPDPKCNNKDIIKTIYRNEASGFKGQIVCATMDSTATGFGAGNKPALLTELFLENGGILGIDDPIKAQDADNPDRQLDVFNHFKSAIESRTNRYTVPILCTGHRTDAEDLFYHIKKDLKPSDYEELIIPVMDVNTGKTINSHLYPTKTMRYFEKSNPIVFYAQYMQAPIKAEGSLFNVDKIQIAQNRPLEENILYSFIACDTASSSHAKADFSVFIHFYVIARKNWREFAIKDEKTNKWKFELEDETEIIKLLVNEIYVERINNKNINDKFYPFLDHIINTAIKKPQTIILEIASSGLTLQESLYKRTQKGEKYFNINDDKKDIKNTFNIMEIKQHTNKGIRFTTANTFIDQERLFIMSDELRHYSEPHASFNDIKNQLNSLTRKNLTTKICDIADALAYGLNNTFFEMEFSKEEQGNLKNYQLNVKNFFQLAKSKLLYKLNNPL